MPALHPPSAAPAAPNVNTKFNPVNPWLRNLRLKLGNRRALLEPTTTARTLGRQRYFQHFVDSLRDRPTTATSILLAVLASRLLGMGFGFLPREGSRLSLTSSQSFFQQPSRPFVLGSQLLILTLELRDLFGNVFLCHMPD